MKAVRNRIDQEASQGKDIMLASIDNRLDGITKDAVFKIKISDLVCEFQFVLTFSQV